jgi:TolA-binding protein
MKRSVNHALAAAVLGIGLAGGVVVAQTPTATTGSGTATTQAPSGTSTTQNQPGQPGQPGQMGPRGMGPGGPDGPGRGQLQTPTTASVTTEIGNLTKTLTSVKADSDFANGKMDLTTVSALINQATALQTQAQTALTANNLTLASGDARAAESALRSADDLIVASIGTTGLPSAANRPARPTPTTPTTTPTADQQKARSSNELARTYKQIVDEGNTVKANSSTAAGDLSFYITTAQGLYKQAYDLYNAGKYDQASQTVRAAGSVAGIAGELLRAAGVTPTGPQVVPVPAPTF